MILILLLVSIYYRYYVIRDYIYCIIHDYIISAVYHLSYEYIHDYIMSTVHTDNMSGYLPILLVYAYK